MGLFDKMQAPARQPIFGAIADALGSLNDYASKPDKAMPGGMANPPLSMLAQALSLPALAKTADRVSYGDALTNSKTANVPFFKPETADALMMAPLSPRTALGAVGLAAGVGDAGAMRAATVWHGSPHKFDKFDASKIGTGEGAQAYGHGIYTAEHPAVAQQYADSVKDMGAIKDINTKLSQLSKEMEQYRGAEYGKFRDPKGYELKAQYDALMDARSGVSQAPGNLYKVDLPDEHIAKMLDWDKPLSQQAPGVRDLLRKQGISGKSWDVQALGDGPQGYLNDRYVYDNAFDARKQINELRAQGYYARPFGDAMGKNKTGAEFVHDLNDPAQQSERLRTMGIPGIRYLDGGSRSAGQGSSNFVIFPGNENLLQILERNGQPLK